MKKLLTNLSLSVLIASLAGCGLFSPVQERKIDSFEINDTSSVVASCESNQNARGVLYVSPMRADTPYDSTKMYYGESEYLLNSYSYGQWATLPTDMIVHSAMKSIFNACLFKNVVSANAIADANYRLVTQLINLRQTVNVDNNTAEVKLIIVAQLIDLEHNRVVFTHIFNESAATQPGPKAMAIGLNQLVAAFDHELVAWLKQNN